MNILQEVGLTKNEARLYERLLQLGECSVGTLHKSLQIHPQIAYRAIEGLIKKGLILSITKKNKKYVSAEHPRKLEELEKERLDKLQKSLPELELLMKPPEGSLVKTSVGVEAVRALRQLAIQELRPGGKLMVIGGSGDRFYQAMGERYEEIEKQRIKKRIRKMILAFWSEKEKWKKDPFRLYTFYRYFAASHPTLASMNIFGEHAAIIIWAAEPIVIHIKNQEVAVSYARYFQQLWETAKDHDGSNIITR